MNDKQYDVIIVGGGISGAALFYELAKYSDVEKICIFILPFLQDQSIQEF